MNKFHIMLVALICIAGLALAATFLKPGQQSNPIRIGINEWAGYDPFILANKLDLFKKNNVAVEVTRFASTTDEMAALKNGQIQGGGFTLDEAFSIVNSGFKAKIVLVVDYSMGGDMLIGQKEVANLSQLVGKTVGFEGSVVGEFLLDRALRASHVKRRDIKLVDVQADKWLSAFTEKRVDAIVCFNPVATKLLNDHEGNLLFSSADMPFEIIDVLLFSESFYDDNKSAIATILKTWFETLKYIDTHLDEAANLVSAEKNISPEDYELGLDDLFVPDLKVNNAIMDSKSDENIYKYAQVIVDFMLSAGLLSQRINTADIFASDILFELELDSESQ